MGAEPDQKKDWPSEPFHPFRWVEVGARRRVFVGLLAGTVVTMVFMTLLGAPLKTDAAPNGILSFEFAGDLATAQAMMDSWDERARMYAGIQMGLDYLFLAAYGLCLSLGCVLVSTWLMDRARRFAGVGIVLSWAMLAAALLDGVENWALIRLLLGSGSNAAAAVAKWCALPKFGLTLAGILYLGTGLLLGLVVRKPESGNRL